MTATVNTATELSATHLEDFVVGRRFTTSAAPVASTDRSGRVHGTQVAAAFASSAIAPGEDLDSTWRYLAPVVDGAVLTFDSTVTQCRRMPDLGSGVVVQYVRVTDADGVLVQDGQTTSVVPVRTLVDDSADRVGRAFGTRAWATALSARLNDDPAFRTETSTWDGTLGIRCGEHEVQFRVYRGMVLEAVSRTPSGPTFVVEAKAHDWVDLFTGPSNDFARRAMGDQFHVHGNAYEYLRLTAALVALVDQARELAHAGRTA